MKYAVEMGPAAMMYIPSFIKIGSDIQQLIGRDSQTAWYLISLLLFFQNKESRLKTIHKRLMWSVSCEVRTEFFKSNLD
jgi:hypothetical protein